MRPRRPRRLAHLRRRGPRGLAAATGVAGFVPLFAVWATLVVPRGTPTPGERGSVSTAGRCTTPDPQRVKLRATSSATGGAGFVELTMAPSPYGVSVSSAGNYVFDLTVHVQSLRRRPGIRYTVWASTPDLEQVRKLGILSEDGVISSRVNWNKFLIFITAEASADVPRWQGPILLTAMSPSGWMHTMRGHGIFEAHGIGC